MAAPKDVKDTAVVVVTDRSKLSALVGPIADRVLAFDQIGANLASLQLNGWKTTQMCKAACWLADGAGMHPAVFIQNHYCMEIQGKLLVEPKWEFIVGVLQSRMPGFQMEVLIETDDCAEVRMSATGVKPQTVRYDLNDAKRQGLLTRGGNMWTSGNTREGCLKQAIKRCGRRIGAAALMDLPMGIEGTELVPLEEQPASAAESIDKAIEKAVGGPVDALFEEAELQVADHSSVAPQLTPAESPRVRLNALVTARFPGLSKADTAAKVGSLYAEMMRERTGAEWVGPNKIGPVEAEQLIEYIGKGGGASVSDAGAFAGTQDSVGPAPQPAPDVPPPAEQAKPERVTDRTIQDAYDELGATVIRAQKLFGRKFIQEFPPGGGVYWFADLQTFSQAGDTQPIKVQKEGRIVASQAKLEQLNAILEADCNKKERGGKP